MARLRYVGSIEAIKGEFFDVPDELSGAKACEWIELQYEIALIDAELKADAEKAAAEAEVFEGAEATVFTHLGFADGGGSSPE